MRCKAGDLAQYVGRDKNCSGYIVKCDAVDPLFAKHLGEPGWFVSPPLPRDDGQGDARSVADRALRPIRDPGDDARDETLDWLPVPAKEAENA